ncbi:MAG: hypothetical protein JWQ66_816 [Mucilaginibacter sp.]|nr:hypothetical protein [Mucilaginibacter sp.]
MLIVLFKLSAAATIFLCFRHLTLLFATESRKEGEEDIFILLKVLK